MKDRWMSSATDNHFSPNEYTEKAYLEKHTWKSIREKVYMEL